MAMQKPKTIADVGKQKQPEILNSIFGKRVKVSDRSPLSERGMREKKEVC